MKQGERDALLIRMDEHVKGINEKIEDMQDILFGNGKVGLCYIVDRNSTTLRNVKWFVGVGIPVSICIIAFLLSIK